MNRHLVKSPKVSQLSPLPSAQWLKVEQSAARRAWRRICWGRTPRRACRRACRGVSRGCCISRAQRPSQHDTLRLPTGTAEDAWYRAAGGRWPGSHMVPAFFPPRIQSILQDEGSEKFSMHHYAPGHHLVRCHAVFGFLGLPSKNPRT